MSELSIIVEPHAPKAWTEVVERGLRNHNTAATGIVEFYPVGFVIKNASGAILGGLFGNVVGGWLHVRSLWVDPVWRGRGYATELMAAAERYAIAKGCIAAALQTASYEARPLYEKLGYRVFGEINDHPVKGHSRYYLAKRPPYWNRCPAPRPARCVQVRDAAVCVRRGAKDRQRRHPRHTPMRR